MSFFVEMLIPSFPSYFLSFSHFPLLIFLSVCTCASTGRCCYRQTSHDVASDYACIRAGAQDTTGRPRRLGSGATRVGRAARRTVGTQTVCDRGQSATASKLHHGEFWSGQLHGDDDLSATLHNAPEKTGQIFY